MIKDVEPNKYVLETVKSRDPGQAPFWAWPGSRVLNFGTQPSITFQRMKEELIRLGSKSENAFPYFNPKTPKFTAEIGKYVPIIIFFTSFFLCWIGNGKYNIIRDDE